MNIKKENVKEADQYKIINKCLNLVKKYDYSLLVNLKDGINFYILNGYRCFIYMDSLCTKNYVANSLSNKDILKLTIEKDSKYLEDEEYIFT